MNGQGARLLMLLGRDLVLVAVAVALWSATLDATPGTVAAIALSIVTALLTTVCGYLAHEWGHLLGALSARSAVALPATPVESFFLFRFDSGRNSGRQFCAMSLGGFIASIIAVVVLVVVLPAHALATWITLALTALGVLATFILEVPEFLRVWRGGALPTGAAYVSGAEPRA